MKLLIAVTLYLFSHVSTAECRYVWVDHDYNVRTALVQRQVCDSPIDLPALPKLSLPPLVLPWTSTIALPTLDLVPCKNINVYENGEWVVKKVCSK